jgi:phenylalanyl-tRNA synthetase alpha chain
MASRGSRPGVALYSLMLSCRQNGVDPEAYLADVLMAFAPTPATEMDVECQLCHGSGCPACKGTGWMEILGCGMVHPAVLENCQVDSERYTGWAFGMGPHRIAMLRYGIPDIRLLLEGDMRFLERVSRQGDAGTA